MQICLITKSLWRKSTGISKLVTKMKKNTKIKRMRQEMNGPTKILEMEFAAQSRQSQAHTSIPMHRMQRRVFGFESDVLEREGNKFTIAHKQCSLAGLQAAGEFSSNQDAFSSSSCWSEGSNLSDLTHETEPKAGLTQSKKSAKRKSTRSSKWSLMTSAFSLLWISTWMWTSAPRRKVREKVLNMTKSLRQLAPYHLNPSVRLFHWVRRLIRHRIYLWHSKIFLLLHRFFLWRRRHIRKECSSKRSNQRWKAVGIVFFSFEHENNFVSLFGRGGVGTSWTD